MMFALGILGALGFAAAGGFILALLWSIRDGAL